MTNSITGLDFSPSRIRKAKEKIAKTAQYKAIATAQCLNIIELSSENFYTAHHDVPIFIFPFNVFGNLAPISLLLAKMRRYQYDFLLSVYKNDSKTQSMRRDYYMSCDYNNIIVQQDQMGVLFKSDDGLYTVAYAKDYLCTLLKGFGFTTAVLETTYGLIIHVMNLPFATAIENPFESNSPEDKSDSSRHKHPSRIDQIAIATSFYIIKIAGKHKIRIETGVLNANLVTLFQDPELSVVIGQLNRSTKQNKFAKVFAEIVCDEPFKAGHKDLALDTQSVLEAYGVFKEKYSKEIGPMLKSNIAPSHVEMHDDEVSDIESASSHSYYRAVTPPPR